MANSASALIFYFYIILKKQNLFHCETSISIPFLFLLNSCTKIIVYFLKNLRNFTLAKTKKINYMKKIFLIASVFILNYYISNACTNFLITKGATADGSVIITYSADSHQLYGELYFYPAADHTETKLPIYEWDTGKYLGEIDQVPHTYQVVGNMNEYQVVIGETTYGGLPQLQEQDNAILDYGSLIYITLQRAKTAREAIRIMAELMDKYGYYSEGESFSIGDKNEAWIMEVIGKGNYEKGAVWVAVRIPNGYISAHANQARITTFEYQKKNRWDDPNATVFNSPDVISFARKIGIYKGKDKDFSFSDVYAPVNFEGARWCEIRVWSFFKAVNKEFAKDKEYFEYVKGNIKYDDKFYYNGKPNPNHFASNRMPLYIKPDHKLTVHEVMNLMRDHLEGTYFDMSKDIGALHHLPYRWRPLDTPIVMGKDTVIFFNERAVATQQTGFSFVAQSRSWLPDHIGGLFWFCVDDAANSVYTPIYCGINHPPKYYSKGYGNMITWNDNSAFWIFNQVANLAYTRYDSIHAEIEQEQQNIENHSIAYTPYIDNAAKEIYKTNPDLADDFITDYSCDRAESLVRNWKQFYTYLFMRYKDGNVMKKDPNAKWKLKVNKYNRNIPPTPYWPGYRLQWYKCVIEKTGDKFIMPKK